jgi:hypothetical protein
VEAQRTLALMSEGGVIGPPCVEGTPDEIH